MQENNSTIAFAAAIVESRKKGNGHELIQSNPTSKPQTQKGKKHT